MWSVVLAIAPVQAHIFSPKNIAISKKKEDIALRITATAASQHTLLEWKAAPSATSYEIIRIERPVGLRKVIASVPHDPLNGAYAYEDRTIEPNKKYVYALRAIQRDFSTVVGPVSPVRTVRTMAPAVASLNQETARPTKKFFYVIRAEEPGGVRDFQQVEAQLLYRGSKAEIWGQIDHPYFSQVQSRANEFGVEFDQVIHPLVTQHFYNESDIDRNGTIAIFFGDVLTNKNADGYTIASDLCTTCASQYSNAMEIMYVKIHNGVDGDAIKSTMAHELQHIVNANPNIPGKRMDLWLNEALSEVAERMYEEQRSDLDTHRHVFSYFSKSEEIRNGHSLLRWMKNSHISYVLSHLFGQYLRAQFAQQYGKSSRVHLFRELIVNRRLPATKNVELAVQKWFDPSLTFGTLMTNFRIALLRKSPVGRFGFGGFTPVESLRVPYYEGTAKVMLYGGGAIVKRVPETLVKRTPEIVRKPRSAGPNIRYTYLQDLQALLITNESANSEEHQPIQ
jgi:hypothetical protein